MHYTSITDTEKQDTRHAKLKKRKEVQYKMNLLGKNIVNYIDISFYQLYICSELISPLQRRFLSLKN